eukprot:6187737-Pleurochrysis_carterae.AAC.1
MLDAVTVCGGAIPAKGARAAAGAAAAAVAVVMVVVVAAVGAEVGAVAGESWGVNGAVRRGRPRTSATSAFASAPASKSTACKPSSAAFFAAAGDFRWWIGEALSGFSWTEPRTV